MPYNRIAGLSPLLPRIDDPEAGRIRSTNRVEYRPRWGLVSARSAQPDPGDGFDGVEFLRAVRSSEGGLRRRHPVVARSAQWRRGIAAIMSGCCASGMGHCDDGSGCCALGALFVESHAMGLLTFGLNVTLDGCIDHTQGIVDDALHDYWTQLMDQSGAMLFG